MGQPVTNHLISHWEADRWSPNIDHVLALEQILEPHPTLAVLAGLPNMGVRRLVGRIRELERRLVLVERRPPEAELEPSGDSSPKQYALL